MKIILLKDVKGIGRKYEEKTISDGYAINFLIPKKFAVAANGAAAGQIKALKDAEDKHRSVDAARLAENIAKLAGTEVQVSLKANDKGHLFASLNKEKIAEILKEKGIEIDFNSIKLDAPIKDVGTVSIPVLVGSKETHFTLIIKDSK